MRSVMDFRMEQFFCESCGIELNGGILCSVCEIEKEGGHVRVYQSDSGKIVMWGSILDNPLQGTQTSIMDVHTFATIVRGQRNDDI